MTPGESWLVWVGVILATCSDVSAAYAVDVSPATTAGSIAIENLDHEIAQRGEEAGGEELLLARSRFLGDYEALDRAVRFAESRFGTGDALLRRARTRSAVHRFADALADIAAAERLGVGADEGGALRASILVATGRAGEVVRQLEVVAVRHPSFASRSALAGAYAAGGHFQEADRMYVAALATLDSTSPFPHAWVQFARGEMWAENAGDPARGETLYRRALTHLPEFAAANIHLAELEVARGELASAMARLERVVLSTAEPQALSLLGELHLRTGCPERGWVEVARARERYETLLNRHPLAFADHAAEFYLGPGADAERAWVLAQQNLVGRRTDRAIALALRAAQATGRHLEACAVAARTGTTGSPCSKDP